MELGSPKHYVVRQRFVTAVIRPSIYPLLCLFIAIHLLYHRYLESIVKSPAAAALAYSSEHSSHALTIPRSFTTEGRRL